MSAEKNPVVGCDAFIMKNLWEIRARESDQKRKMEQERVEKSALPSINKDWKNRMTTGVRTHKGVERKVKPADTQTEENIWRRREQVPPSRPLGSGPFRRPGGSAPSVLNRRDKKLHLLGFISRMQPCAMVWGKSWKDSQFLSVEEERGRSQQLNSEKTPANVMDAQSLLLWKKPGNKALESQELDVVLASEEWKTSWRRSNSNQSSAGGRRGFFTSLLETQRLHEASNEWSESWKSTKMEDPQEDSTLPKEGLMNESVPEGERSSGWEDCWRLVNQHGFKRSQFPLGSVSHSPEWRHSWRAANPDHSLRKDPRDLNDDVKQQKNSHFHRIRPNQLLKFRDLNLQLCDGFKYPSEWSHSWQMFENNSKPCGEKEKVLKMEVSSQVQESEENSEEEDGDYEQLKQEVIYSKPTSPQSEMHLLTFDETVSFYFNWEDSWRRVKGGERVERRRARPLRVLESGRGLVWGRGLEWSDSWRLSCVPLRQDSELWLQRWNEEPQTRRDRAMDENHIPPVELNQNGPSAERSWGGSWRIWRGPEPEPGSKSIRLQPYDSQAQRSGDRLVCDWTDSWRISEVQFYHHTPSLIQWWDAWRSVSWAESTETRVNHLMEIRPQREKASRSFDHQMFRKRFPEENWSTSWRSGSLLSHKPTYYRSSASKTIDQPGSRSDPSNYTLIWSREKYMRNKLKPDFSSSPEMIQLWKNSHQSVRVRSSVQIRDQRVILTKEIQPRRSLFSDVKNEEQLVRKSAGCHLLSKTQPRPKRGGASVKKIKMEDEKKEKLVDEWARSWKLSIEEDSVKNQMVFKSLSGWTESWKSLLPLYQMINGSKAR